MSGDEARLALGLLGALAASGALAACFAAARVRGGEGWAWGLLGAAAACSALSLAAWAAWAEASAPGAVAGLTAAGLLAGTAVAVFPGAPQHASGRGRTLVDALIVSASALLVAWTLGLDGLYAEAGSTRLLDVALSLVAITNAAGAGVILTRAVPEARPRLAIAAGGLTALALAAGSSTYLALGGAAAWIVALGFGWALGWLMLAAAARQGGAAVNREIEPGLPTRASVFIPSVPFAVSVVVLAATISSGGFDGFVVWNAAALIVLVVARQVLALVENISFWRRLEGRLRARTDELRRSEAHFRSLVQHSSDVIAVLDADASLRYLSPAAGTAFGYDPEVLLSAPPLDLLLHEDDMPEVRMAAARLRARAGATVALECRVRRRDGEWRSVEAVARNLLDDPAVGGYVVNARDITERKRGLELSHRAFHDPLTDLANRALLGSRLDRALARSRRRGGGVAVLFCDLDQFKRVNDSLGHDVGDAILCAIGDRLLACARPEDTIARLGGDEFAILLEQENAAEGAAAVAERVLEALRPSLEVGGHRVFVGGSIGIATDTSSGVRETSADELLRNADMAMYKAKRAGGGRYEYFEPSMHTALMERLRIEERLRAAVGDGELSVHYQPVVRLDGGPMFAVEALVRWPQPGGELWAPGRFIQVAEETGLIVPLGRLVLRKACTQVADWSRRYPDHPPGPVMVNISAAQLHDADLVDDVRGALAQASLDPSRLVLEITESLAVEGAAMTARLAELRELGVRIGIDDFGSEYSSFAYLRKLPIEILKIDGQFMAGIEESTRGAGLVEGILAVAESMGCVPVAEGVETPEQAEALRRMGCGLAQGYLFARPGPPEEIDRLLEQGGARRSTPA